MDFALFWSEIRGVRLGFPMGWEVGVGLVPPRAREEAWAWAPRRDEEEEWN